MKLLRQVVTLSLPFVGATALLSAGPVHAGGFALNEMSAASVGNAHAGTAAAEDPSTIYFNPAGLMLQSGRQFMAAGSAIRPSAKFRNQGSTSAAGTPMTGGNGGDAGGWAFVPALYYAMDLSPDMRFGIGMQAPFGLTTEYDDGWVGRYQALKSDLLTVNINPTLAYRLNDAVSFGAGISAQYIDVELSRAIDFGSVCIGAIGAGVCGPAGFTPQARDGEVNIKGDDWGFGYNLGVMFTPRPDLRWGLAYRSKIKHKLKGDAEFEQPAGLPAPIAASPVFTNGGVRSSVDLPESVSLGGYAALDQRWEVMADITWMRWSRFKELRIRFDNGAPDNVTAEEWRDTVRVSAGVNYRYNDAWKLRGGIAFDESPVKTEFRTPRVPDANRVWLAFGAQYKPTRHSSWNFGYAHLFVKDSSINKAEPPVGGTLVGNYENDVNILSAQYHHAF